LVLEKTMTKKAAQERMYNLTEERDYLSTLEASINDRQQRLIEETRELFRQHNTLRFRRKKALFGGRKDD
jgi:CHASE3 domain sensor protein